MANSLKYAQNPRKYLVAKATLLDVVSLTDWYISIYSGFQLGVRTRLWVPFSQSQCCISSRTSNHGISPNDKVSDSQTVLMQQWLTPSLYKMPRVGKGEREALQPVTTERVEELPALRWAPRWWGMPPSGSEIPVAARGAGSEDDAERGRQRGHKRVREAEMRGFAVAAEAFGRVRTFVGK
jgi:hypothetical protein